MKKTITSVYFVLILPLFGQDMMKEKVLEEHIPEDMVLSHAELPRNDDVLSIKAVVEKSDQFLRTNFGEDFKVQLKNVSIMKRFRPNGFIWCWHITYFYPQIGNKEMNTTFMVTLSLDGEPLMKVHSRKK